MNCLFLNMDNFNGDISRWNVSNVKNFNYMFMNCKNFKTDLSNWDLKNVKYMQGMFKGVNYPYKDLV